MSLNECLVLGPDPVTIQSRTHFHLEGGTVLVQLILLLEVQHCLKWDTAPHHSVQNLEILEVIYQTILGVYLML